MFLSLRSVVCVTLLAGCAFAQGGSVWETKRSGWQTLPASDRARVEQFAADYKAYIGGARSALASTAEMIRQARAAGFAEFTAPAQVKPGARLFVNNRDRSIALFIVGQEPITAGLNIVGAHHDSPHIKLKARPVIGRGGIALFKTVYYGGIKEYQWANIPLALVGRISTSDGRNIDVSIGLKTGEPVFVIPDNAPHSDRPLRDRKYEEVLKGEELNPVAGSVPAEHGGVVGQVVQTLTATYKIREEDLVGAELLLVPASQPADVGVDRGLIGGYGQDDRLSAFCAVRALMEARAVPRFTAVAYLTNLEEAGSGNTTGARTEAFFTVLARMIAAQNPRDGADAGLRAALRNSVMISADANDGLNPIFGETTSEASNAARVGYGPTIKMYGGAFDPPPEVTARMRGLLDRAGIPWQTQTPRVGVGGGGTIGGFFSVRDIDVIDFGVPLLSMHSPYEVSSKVDVWYFYRFMSEFFAWDRTTAGEQVEKR